jgi:hypothetical protein
MKEELDQEIIPSIDCDVCDKDHTHEALVDPEDEEQEFGGRGRSMSSFIKAEIVESRYPDQEPVEKDIETEEIEFE